MSQRGCTSVGRCQRLSATSPRICYELSHTTMLDRFARITIPGQSVGMVWSLFVFAGGSTGIAPCTRQTHSRRESSAPTASDPIRCAMKHMHWGTILGDKIVCYTVKMSFTFQFTGTRNVGIPFVLQNLNVPILDRGLLSPAFLKET